MDDINIIQDPGSNYKKGYIKLYRSIENHWISCNPYYYQAFNRLLFRVNHTKNTELIEGEIIECDRGQSIYSLSSWVDIFNKKLKKRWWTIQKVRTFFSLMQKDNMLVIEGLRKTTRLTICNYESYQSKQHRDNTEITHSQHTANTELTTTKGIKELNTLKELEIKESFSLFWNKYHTITKILKTDKDSAFKYWKKLTNQERQKADDSINDYYNSLNDKKFCKKARTYLSDKNFNDEFINKPNGVIRVKNIENGSIKEYGKIEFKLAKLDPEKYTVL
jgi:hypothetical protein